MLETLEVVVNQGTKKRAREGQFKDDLVFLA